MFRKHAIRHLSAYHHEELSSGERVRVESHLRECSRCRAADEEIRRGVRLASLLSLSTAPESIWKEIQSAPRVPARRSWIPRIALAGAALAIVLVAGLSLFVARGPSWEVIGLPGTSHLRPGDVLQTDSVSQAQVRIADIGRLTVAPNTRIRLLVTRPDEHRIALDRGKVEATTVAPPRLFMVDTPSATAVDLGCQYTLEVEDDGSSLLHVTLGLVALELPGRETIVPAGAFCRTRSGAGPGTPFFEDSTAEFQTALEFLDSGMEGPERAIRLETVLSEARVRDALSLWHLIPRVDAPLRGLIYDWLSKYFPPPPEVTREGIVALDNPKMLDAWKVVVSQIWK